jgi:hypothetical protein
LGEKKTGGEEGDSVIVTIIMKKCDQGGDRSKWKREKKDKI